MFVLFKNKTLKYYNMTPKVGGRRKKDFEHNRLQLWTVPLSNQPHGIAAHPFNFSLVLIYNEILKFHNYNCKQIFPAFLVSPVTNCKLASFSPLGDKLILVTGSCLMVLDSYSLRLMHQVSVPNMSMQTTVNPSPISQQLEPKTINDFKFVSNEQYIFLSGFNTLSEFKNGKTVHFGFLESEEKIKTAIEFDPINKLAVVALTDFILVLSKATLNSNNRCEVVSKIQIEATALLQVAELGIFFIGGRDGTLHMLCWPHYSQ